MTSSTHRRRIGFVEIALADSVREPARPAAVGFDIERLTESESSELGRILEFAYDFVTGCLDWRQVDPWRRFRFAGLCGTAAVESGYAGHRFGMSGLSDVRHAFESCGTASVNRYAPWLRYWLFPEVERPDDLPPLDPQNAESVAHLEYREREGRRIAQEQAAWEAARAFEREDKAKAALR